MSIVAGIWNTDGTPVQPEILSKFSQATATCSPVEGAINTTGAIGFLFRPYYKSPVPYSERQPFYSDQGLIIAWDGRLDNKEELVQQIGDESLASGTDVAVIAASFRRWGRQCLSKLNGDWALAIWNQERKELILARDYIGVKTMFYFARDRQIMWCNHLAPLALSGSRFTLCDEYVAGYLAFQPEATITPYREIHSVPPGGFTVFRNGSVTNHIYWKLDVRCRTRYRTDGEYEECYRHLFRQAVRRRMHSDHPILAELSGGLDSSSIVCVADDLIANGETDVARLDTFSYFDSNEPGEDDFAHFSAVEQRRGRPGIRVDLKGSGDSLPLCDTEFAAVPGFHCRAEIKSAISEITRGDKYRVMLCGLGGDEMNGQSLDPRIQLAELIVQFRWCEFANTLVAWALRMRLPLIQLLLQIGGQFLPSAARAHLIGRGRTESWIQPAFARRERMSVRQLESMPGASLLPPAKRDAMETLATLSKQLTHSVPSLLERRYPFLDRDLVEFLTSIPLEQLLRPGERRSLMRRSLTHLLPPVVVARKTKTSAGRCYPISLAKHWSEIEELLDRPLTEALGYVNRDAMRSALVEMKNGRLSPTFLRLLKALSLEQWLRDVTRRGVLSLDSRLRLTSAEVICRGRQISESSTPAASAAVDI